MKLHTVMPGLYIRGEFRSWTLAKKIAELSAVPIHVVVNLTYTADPDLLYTDVIVFHCPMGDGRRIPPQLDDLARLINDKRHRGNNVLVHCGAGQNRAGLVSARAYMLETGCSGAEAVEHARAVRPNALINQSFVSWLMGLK